MARATRSSAVKAESTPSAQTMMPDPMQLSSPPATPVRRNMRKRKTIKVDEPTKTLSKTTPITPKSNKRAKKSAIKEEDINDLPHNLGAIPDLFVEQEVDEKTSSAKQPRKRSIKATRRRAEKIKDVVAKATSTVQDSPKKKEKVKNSNYGLTPGHTPYPNYPHPTPEECEEVTRLLSKVHGKVQAPKTIPTPSLEVSGCGEVPSVLDALIRTRLSAATSGTNSSRAFAGLVSKFGILKEGVGKGSVDWNKVRLADQKEVFEAIKSGGLADVKSKDIKKILQMVWEENQARREELISKEATGSKGEAAKDKENEIEKAESNIVSLDHLHGLSSEDAFTALTKYPGIGPKTASCVLLFCLQRPSFAVDTHVFRLCRWLGWVPPPGDSRGLAPGAKGTFAGPTRNSTYAHCEVRVPDDLKYPLHQLLIKHGKTCPRCRAITGEGSEGWEKGCPIEHLVKRDGVRKGGEAGSPVKGGAGKSKGGKKVVEEWESDAGSSELSDLVSDAEEEVSESEE
ncbi:hypothetical protein IAQ61_008970 [Plenodomus lingam]|uniref:HhH-GPD domain-containing protein n=1 Tax=Leptosphaeria maculans (strain JN3 / isolate v23.1.3 / race Av1-4-5-6-7-8) TaxID=985895 RepID=E4ZNN8_LEPMJ|nr:hypothetical protein LEMA_P041580.1 [Plenodomus lingam JN3]KAH9865024.1 hypothetical protein IAQ61_008970 [Plenodomus lingam]CBX93257.1 hypothetical protein LEMA_P041580.1 [Plenodomus lingam JN3]